MIFLQCISALAMVVAPRCTGIEGKADTYKLASIAAFGMAYYFLAWRKQSLLAAITIPGVQIAAGWLFLAYLNSQPLTCGR